jgi:histidinol-phosphate aminotransferase
MDDARGIYNALAESGVIVRDRSKVIRCDDCLRITVGTPEENRQLINLLQQMR